MVGTLIVPICRGSLPRRFPRLWERRDKLKREEKTHLIAELKDRFKKANAVVLTDYKGLTVAELFELRRLLRGAGIEYKVVKNTLARAASAKTSLSVISDLLKGPVGIAIGYADPVQVAKKVIEYSKKNNKLKVNGGVVEGRLCNAEDIKSIAALPPREILLSMLAGVFNAPLSKMAGALSATVSSFAYAVNALKDKKSVSG
ncbi:MAG: 50S ribosomal protein L10 [Nitrospirae bacterium]|nr:50S ribosomal protein L10 [Nitrospirota bacterium]MBU4319888.1 50S ribosomal protein L10 [Nitrospinota bacterium]